LSRENLAESLFQRELYLEGLPEVITYFTLEHMDQVLAAKFHARHELSYSNLSKYIEQGVEKKYLPPFKYAQYSLGYFFVKEVLKETGMNISELIRVMARAETMVPTSPKISVTELSGDSK